MNILYKRILFTFALLVIVLLLLMRRNTSSHNIPALSVEERLIRQVQKSKLEMIGRAMRKKRTAYRALLEMVGKEDFVISEVSQKIIKLCQQFLVASLYDDNVESRIAAIEALGRVGNKSHVMKVFAARGVDDLRVRSASLRAIAKLGGKNISDLLVGVLTTEGKAEKISPLVAWVFGEAGDKDHLSFFADALKDRDIRTRIRIAEAIYKMGDRSGIPIIKAALSDENVPVESRLVAAEVLYNTGDKSGLPFIEDALRHGSDEIRQKASATLIRIDETSTVPALKSALADRNVYVRINAAGALYLLSNKSSNSAKRISKGKEVFDKAIQSKDWRVRRAVAIAIGKFHPPKCNSIDESVIHLVEDLLNDSHEQVRAAAVLALGEVRDDSLMPNFRRALKDDTDVVRVRAIEAIAKIAMTKIANTTDQESSKEMKE